MQPISADTGSQPAITGLHFNPRISNRHTTAMSTCTLCMHTPHIDMGCLLAPPASQNRSKFGVDRKPVEDGERRGCCVAARGTDGRHVPRRSVPYLPRRYRPQRPRLQADVVPGTGVKTARPD